jgi:N-methylhydantoinase B/oxoprolinase/acetone carboxylase alpha subunit
MKTQGGGGYGDPHDRSRALTDRDPREGKATPAAVAREYGG